MNLTSPEHTGREAEAAKTYLAALALVPFALGISLLLASFCISIMGNASSSSNEVATGALLLVGLLLVLVGAPIAALTERGRSPRFARGMASAAVGSTLAATWPFIMLYFVFPRYEDVSGMCWDALRDVITLPKSPGHQNTLLPAQVHCEAENVSVPVGLLPGWESWSLTALALVFVGIAAYGIYIMLTSGRRPLTAAISQPR